MKALALTFLDAHGFTPEFAAVAERWIKAGQFAHGDEAEWLRLSEISLLLRLVKNVELRDHRRPYLGSGEFPDILPFLAAEVQEGFLIHPAYLATAPSADNATFLPEERLREMMKDLFPDAQVVDLGKTPPSLTFTFTFDAKERELTFIHGNPDSPELLRAKLLHGASVIFRRDAAMTGILDDDPRFNTLKPELAILWTPAPYESRHYQGELQKWPADHYPGGFVVLERPKG